MNGDDPFLSDPFLSLDNDLDDVSEVIRNNMDGGHQVLFDSPSPNPSPEFLSMPQNWNLSSSKPDEINQIVSLLRENTQRYPNKLEQSSADLATDTTICYQLSEHQAHPNPIQSGKTNELNYYGTLKHDEIDQSRYNIGGETCSFHEPFQINNGFRQPSVDLMTTHFYDGEASYAGNEVEVDSRIDSLQGPTIPKEAIYEDHHIFVQNQKTHASILENLEAVTISPHFNQTQYNNALSMPMPQNILSPQPFESRLKQIKLEAIEDEPENFDQHQAAPQSGNMEQHQNYEENFVLPSSSTYDERTQMPAQIPQTTINFQTYSLNHQLPPSDPFPCAQPIANINDPYISRKFLLHSPPDEHHDDTPLTTNYNQGINIEPMGRYLMIQPPLTVNEVSPLFPSISGINCANGWENDSDESEEFEMPGLMSRAIGRYSKKPLKTERRTAHNLIEKKYRCSINDRINQLKEMLAAGEIKVLSKSATLRKAIDHINSLRSQNSELIKANECLKEALKLQGVNWRELLLVHPALDIKTVVLPTAEDKIQKSKNLPMGRTKKMTTISNQSRVALCTFMFMLFLTNPFAIIFSSDFVRTDSIRINPEPTAIDNEHSSIHLLQKTLADNDQLTHRASFQSMWQWQSSTLRQAFIWLVNIMVIMVVLVRLLIIAEPINQCFSWSEATTTKKNVLKAMEKGNYNEAQRQLYGMLNALGRPIANPNTLDELMSLIWQCLRHMLNSIWIGRWLSRRRRSINQSEKIICRSHALTALAYHQLNELDLISRSNLQNRFRGFNLALCSVNFAESAGIGSGFGHKMRAEIYLYAAFRAQLFLPQFFARITSSYFFRRAKRHVKKIGDKYDKGKLIWIFHPLARQFFNSDCLINTVLKNDHRQSDEHFPFSNYRPPPMATLELLENSFKIHLLRRLMLKLKTSNNQVRAIDFIEISDLLLDMCEPEGISTESAKDDICAWWAHLLTCGLYWSIGDGKRAQEHYSVIRKCPQKLLNNGLTLGIGMAFCSRKMCLDDQMKKNFAEMVWLHITKSFTYFEQDVNFPRQCSRISDMIEIIRWIGHEWILTSLVEIWQYRLVQREPYWHHNAPSYARHFYHNALGKFRAMSEDTENEKVITFTVLERALCGANPVTTWKVFKTLAQQALHGNKKRARKIESSSHVFDYLDLIQRLQINFTEKYNFVGNSKISVVR